MADKTAESRASRKRGTVTMNDVARHAGVALGTVSNSLNRPEHVTPELRERVLASIAELGFVRNRAASNLAAGVSNTVGVVLVDLANSYFTDMVRGAEQAAHEERKFLVIANSDISEQRQRSYLHYFDEEQVAGILVAPLSGTIPERDRSLGRQRPLVVLDAAPDLSGFCAVSTDNHSAGRIAAEHLLGLGRRRIAFAGGPLDRSRALADRFQGATDAVNAVPGATLEHLPTGEVRVSDGRAVGELLSARSASDLPDGVVAAADLLALGIVQVLTSTAQYRFPEHIALIACDDNRSAHDSLVPISTVDLPGFAMGATGMRLLLEELHHDDAHVHQHITLEPTLTARESTLGRQTSVATLASGR